MRGLEPSVPLDDSGIPHLGSLWVLSELALQPSRWRSRSQHWSSRVSTCRSRSVRHPAEIVFSSTRSDGPNRRVAHHLSVGTRSAGWGDGPCRAVPPASVDRDMARSLGGSSHHHDSRPQDHSVGMASRTASGQTHPRGMTTTTPAEPASPVSLRRGLVRKASTTARSVATSTDTSQGQPSRRRRKRDAAGERDRSRRRHLRQRRERARPGPGESEREPIIRARFRDELGNARQTRDPPGQTVARRPPSGAGLDNSHG